MLIDTNQVISKTELRHNLNEVMDRIQKGSEMVVADRGKLIAAIVPIHQYKKHAMHTDSQDLLAKTLKVAERLDRSAKRWNSTDALRKSREQRAYVYHRM